MTTPAQRRRKAERIGRSIADAIRALESLDQAKIADLLRRAEQTNEVDGYRSAAGDGQVSGGSVGEPTAAAAMARIDHTERDPIGENLEELFATLQEITAGTKRVKNLVDAVIYAGDQLKGRVTTIRQCRCCYQEVTGIGNDRLRSGYGPACHRSWKRAGSPTYAGGRVRFEQERRAQLEAAANGTPTE